jgi:hypothetical protein
MRLVTEKKLKLYFDQIKATNLCSRFRNWYIIADHLCESQNLQGWKMILP